MSLPKLLSLLGRQALHFARSDTLGDPYEGLHSDVDIAAYEALIASGIPEGPEKKAEVQRLVDALQDEPAKKMRRGVYVNCWHRSEEEQAAMWRVYAADHGIAIRTTFDDLTRSVLDDRTIYAGAVRYIDYRTEPTQRIQMNAFNPFTCKRLSFKSDSEVRLVFSDLDAAFGTPEGVIVDAPEGDFVRVDIDRLVRDVFVSPEQPAWFAEVVRDVVGRYGIAPERVTHSDLYAPI